VILDIARAVPIETEIAHRGIKLSGHRSERVGPCPVCGGKDRFSINTMKGLWNCRGCYRGGDVIDLVQHLDGVSHKVAVRMLAGTERVHTPLTMARPRSPPPVPVKVTDNSEFSLQLWADAGPIAETYLHRRGLHALSDDNVLRFLTRCPFDGGRRDRLLALYRDIITDEPKAIARTAIDASGNKIGRMSLGPVGGCAIKVDDDTDVEQGLVVGEGFESVLAGRQFGFRPAWALGSANAIKTFSVLAGIEALSILVDNDAPDNAGRRAGQTAAIMCSARWTAAGIEVRRVVPRGIGVDMADLVARGDRRHG
jgi:phage/plasmid primase-like uncharacterized protein